VVICSLMHVFPLLPAIYCACIISVSVSHATAAQLGRAIAPQHAACLKLCCIGNKGRAPETASVRAWLLITDWAMSEHHANTCCLRQDDDAERANCGCLVGNLLSDVLNSGPCRIRLPHRRCSTKEN